MSNTSDFSASGGPGKKPQNAGTTGNASGRTPGAALSGQVSGAVREGGRELQKQAANVAESAKDLASQAGEKLLDSAEKQKVASADFVSGMAGAVRRAAKEFDHDVPQAAQYIRSAADQIDAASDAFRRRDLRQLIGDVEGFARSQPTAFLGAALFAGFAVVRFLKTSTAGAQASRNPATSHHGT